MVLSSLFSNFIVFAMLGSKACLVTSDCGAFFPCLGFPGSFSSQVWNPPVTAQLVPLSLALGCAEIPAAEFLLWNAVAPGFVCLSFQTEGATVRLSLSVLGAQKSCVFSLLSLLEG